MYFMMWKLPQNEVKKCYRTRRLLFLTTHTHTQRPTTLMVAILRRLMIIDYFDFWGRTYLYVPIFLHILLWLSGGKSSFKECKWSYKEHQVHMSSLLQMHNVWIEIHEYTYYTMIGAKNLCFKKLWNLEIRMPLKTD